MRLEAVLVEVVRRPAPRPEEKVSLEKRVVAEPAGELRVGHPRAEPRMRRAMGRSRSPSGEPGVNETIEPSAK